MYRSRNYQTGRYDYPVCSYEPVYSYGGWTYQVQPLLPDQNIPLPIPEYPPVGPPPPLMYPLWPGGVYPPPGPMPGPIPQPMPPGPMPGQKPPVPMPR
jgi:hypothetical protein